MRQRFLAYLLFPSVLAISACAASKETQTSDPNVLTQAELTDAVAANLLEAVERLRPRWLQIRGARSINSSVQIAVFLNRTYLGEPEVLRSYHPKSVLRVRYMDGPTASASLSGFDSRHVQGAIIIETATTRN